MSTQIATQQPNPIARLKQVLSADSVQEQFRNALQDNAPAFVASIIDLYGSDQYLQKCNPNAVVMECLKAATLKLPINKQLGFAYVVPYGNVPQFQIGYKGYIQLAMRTGQYRFINAGSVLEGIDVQQDLLTGAVRLSGKAKSDKVQGFFAYMELLNGFSKALFMDYEAMLAHAKRYSKSFDRANSAWKTNFDEMAMKTMIRRLLSKYGIMSIEMVAALAADEEDVDGMVAGELALEANSEILDIADYTVADGAEEASPAPQGEGAPLDGKASQVKPEQQKLPLETPSF